MSDKPFAERLKEARAREGLSQGEMAVRLGILQPSLSRLEHGGNPSAATLQRFEEEFGEEPPTTQPEATAAPAQATRLLLDEMAAARAELGHPMDDAERSALERAGASELLIQSPLLREALEVRASRELLAGAQMFRRKREAARTQGGGRKC